MSTYRKAPELEPIAQPLLDKYYREVLDVKTRIDFLFAYGPVNDDGETTGPAIKHHGVQAIGLCRIIGQRDRAKGMGDIEVTVDGDWWQTASIDQQVALLDHELNHIQLKRDQAGCIVFDDLGRPKIKMRQHDHDYGWFDVIAKRHGTASVEVRQARALREHCGQFYFDLESRLEAVR